MWTLKELSHYYLGKISGRKPRQEWKQQLHCRVCDSSRIQRKTDGFSERPPSEKYMGLPGWQVKRSQLQVKEVSRLKVLSRKDLTRAIRCVNTSCVDFKYNLLTQVSAQQQHLEVLIRKSVEPDYHQSHVGWKVSPVCIKLGENNSRPMGLASYKGIQTETGTATLANKANTSNTLFIGGRGNDLYRGQRITSQGCSDRDPTCSGRLCVTNLSGRKEGGGTEAGNKPEGSQHICEARAFQNGGASHSPRSHPIRRLDDQIGSKGCISPGTNSYRTSTPTSISMGSQKLPISMSPICIDICPTGFLQNYETCGGSTSTHQDLSSHLPRQHPSNASINGATDTADSIDMPAIRGSGSGGQFKEIHAVPSADPGVLGLSSGYSEPTADFPGREAEKNTAVSPAPPAPIKGISEGSSEVCGKDLGGYTCYMASSSAFQSTTIPNEFSGTRGPLCGLRGGLQLREVQYQSDLDQGGQE